MGVTGLWPLLEPVGRRVNIDTLAGKKVAIGEEGVFRFLTSRLECGALSVCLLRALSCSMRPLTRPREAHAMTESKRLREAKQEREPVLETNPEGKHQLSLSTAPLLLLHLDPLSLFLSLTSTLSLFSHEITMQTPPSGSTSSSRR